MGTNIRIKKPRQECRENRDDVGPGELSNQRAEKRVVVYLEIGPNIKGVLEKAIQAAYQSDENIGILMDKMGLDIKTMVKSTVDMG